MKKLLPLLTFFLGAVLAVGGTWYVLDQQHTQTEARYEKLKKTNDNTESLLKTILKEKRELKEEYEKKEAEPFPEIWESGVEVYKYDREISKEAHASQMWVNLVNTLTEQKTGEAFCFPRIWSEARKIEEFIFVTCQNFAYNQNYAVLREKKTSYNADLTFEGIKETEPEKAAIYEIIEFPTFPGSNPSDRFLIGNPSYTPETNFISYWKSRGIGDCGTKAAYKWNEKTETMELLGSIIQEICEGDVDEEGNAIPYDGEAWFNFEAQYIK